MKKTNRITIGNNEIIKKNSDNSRINSIVSNIKYVNKKLKFNRIINLQKHNLTILLHIQNLY